MSYKRFDHSPLGGKIINNVHLIKHRRINNGNQIKRYFDLMSEDKASRCKMEETFCSLPTTVKSTFLMIFSPDGQRVASTHGDDRIYICDLTSGKLIDTLQGHPKTPWCLAWHPINKEILASGCLGGEVRVWDLRSKACDTWSNEQSYDIASLAFHPTDRILVIATSNEIHFWDWSRSKPYAVTSTALEKEKVRFVRFDSSGSKLITGISNLPKVINYNSETLQTGSPYQDRVNFIYNSNGTGNGVRRATTDIGGLPQTDSTAAQTSSSNDEQNATQRRDTSVFMRLKLLYRQLEKLEESPRHSSQAFSRFDVLDNMGPGGRYEATTSNQGPTATRGSRQEDEAVDDGQTESAGQCDQGTQTADVLFNLANLNNGKWTFVGVTPQDVNIDPPRRDSLIRLIQQANGVDALAKLFERSLQQIASSNVSPVNNNNNEMPIPDTQPSTSHQATNDAPIASANPATPIGLDPLHPLYQLDPCRRRHGRILASLRLYRQIACRVALAAMNPLESSKTETTPPPDEIITNPNIVAFGGTTGASNIPDRLSQRLPSEILAKVRGISSIDPILSIQFKGSGRNVPLSSSCRLDLLCARLTIIMHSQKLLEQMNGMSSHHVTVVTNNQTNSGDHSDEEDGAARNSSCLFLLLNQLYRALQSINYSDLVVSNARDFIQKARRRVDRILERLTRIGSPYRDVGHTRQQIYIIARHLTSRDYDSPVSETMNELRLDLIHCLCIVDLALHLTRQLQFMQACEIRSFNPYGNAANAASNNNNHPASKIGPSQESSTSSLSSLQQPLVSRPNTRSQGNDFGRATSSVDDAQPNIIITDDSPLPSTSHQTDTPKRRSETETRCDGLVKRKRKTSDDSGSTHLSKPQSDLLHPDMMRPTTSSVFTRSMTRAAKQSGHKTRQSGDSLAPSTEPELSPTTNDNPRSGSQSQQSGQSRTNSNRNVACIHNNPRFGQIPAVLRFVNNIGNFSLDSSTDNYGPDPYANHTIRPIGAYISGPVTEGVNSFTVRNSTSPNGMVHIVVGVFSPNEPAPSLQFHHPPESMSSVQAAPTVASTSSSNPTSSPGTSAIPINTAGFSGAGNNRSPGLNNRDRPLIRQEALQEEPEFLYENNMPEVIRLPHDSNNYHPNMGLQILQARQRRLAIPGVENGNVIAVQGAIIYSQQDVSNIIQGPGSSRTGPNNHPSTSGQGRADRPEQRPHGPPPFSRNNLFANSGEYPISPNLNHWWWNSWGIAFSNQTHYRIQCWDFSQFKLPDIKDSQANVVTGKSRIHNDASIDISSDGQLLACLVPQSDGMCTPPIDFKIYSLNSKDFGTCYYRWSCGPTTRSVSISPLGGYVVVGLTCQKSSFVSDPSSDTMVIARIFKLNGPDSLEHVRDITIKRNDYLMSLNLIKWLPRSGQGLIYGTNRGQLIIARPISSDQQYSVDMKNVDFQLGSNQLSI